MLKIVKTSVIGPGHVDADLPNQDATGHFNNDKSWGVVVCDGMGSRAYADIGSQTAVHSIKFVLKKSDFGMHSKALIAAFYRHWLDAIKLMAIKPNDAVTTALIVWGDHQGNFRVFQLGDGMICSLRECYTPLSTEEFSNVTTGMGLSKSFSDWTVSQGRLSADNNAILLMSDGISEDLTEHCAFTRALVEYSKHKSSRRVKKHLNNMFKQWATPFHTDDKSLAMVILNDKK